jgi:glycosyltransferase involved in cell wall biosynthesis
LLIGGGEDLPLLRGQAARLGLTDRIYFTGQLPHQAVSHYLRIAVVSVDPVRDDDVARARSPLKILESMVLGVPVVTGDVGDRAALLDGGRAGILVAPGDSNALAAALITLLHDQQRQQALATAAREHSQTYAWDIIAGQWEQIYQRA